MEIRDWRLEIVVKKEQHKTKHSFDGLHNVLGDWRLGDSQGADRGQIGDG